MKKICDFNIALEKGNLSDDLPLWKMTSGVLIIIPKQTIHTESLRFELQLHSEGRVNAKLMTLDSGAVFSDARTLEKGKEYRFPIEFRNTIMENYNGMYVEFTICLELFMRIKKLERHKEEQGFFAKTNLMNLIPWNKTYKHTFYLQYHRGGLPYRIPKQASALEFEYKPLIEALIWFSIIILIYIGFELDISLYAASLLACPILFCYILGVVFKEITHIEQVQFDQTEEQLEVKIDSKLRWMFVKKMFVGFEVREIISNGEKTNMHAHKIYNSPLQTVEDKGNDYTLYFDLPANAPVSYVDGRINIEWRLIIWIELIGGFKFKYSAPFMVGLQNGKRGLLKKYPIKDFPLSKRDALR